MLSRSVSSLYFSICFSCFLLPLLPDACFCSCWFCRASTALIRGGWQILEWELPTAFQTVPCRQLCEPRGDRGMCRAPHAQAWPVVPALLGVMGNEKRVQHDSGVCCGNVERASFTWKVRLEIEAWNHSKSGMSHRLLKSFFYLLFLSMYTQRKSCFRSTWKRAGCLEYGKRIRKKPKL